MRGTARHVDGDGKCNSMKLYTTMDIGQLLTSYRLLFPGAKPPQHANSVEHEQSAPLRGRQALIKLLSDTTQRATLGADEIQVVTGIHSSKLTREFDAIGEIIIPLGWSLKPASELKLSGRMKYLVHEARLAQSFFVGGNENPVSYR
jgi:hypothetical protein